MRPSVRPQVPAPWWRHAPLSVSFTLLAAAYMLASAAVALILTTLLPDPWWAILVAPLLLVPVLVFHVRHAFAPMRSLFRALSGSVTSYRDGDFGFGLSWEGGGELGELVAAHNALGDALRDQRIALVQRELLT